MKINGQSGFTIIELVAVIVIIGVLAVGASSFSQNSGLQQLYANKMDVQMAVQNAQHLAMAKAGPSRVIEFVSLGSSIDVRDSGNSVVVGAIQYPLVLTPGHQLSTATLSFNKLGQTQATTLTLQGSAESITLQVETTGIIN